MPSTSTVDGKGSSANLKAGTVVEKYGSSSGGSIKVRGINTNGTFTVKASSMKKVKQGAVQGSSSSRTSTGRSIAKGEKVFAYTIKKGSQVLTSKGWVSKSKVKAVNLSYYKAKKRTDVVWASGKMGSIGAGTTIQGFDFGKAKFKSGTKWWVEANKGFVNSGDMKLVGTYKIEF